MPFALKGTSGHVHGRSTTFDSSLLDGSVCYDGRLEMMPMSGGTDVSKKGARYCARLSNWRGGQVEFCIADGAKGKGVKVKMDQDREGRIRQETGSLAVEIKGMPIDG